jgi:hypothetical protein
VTIKNAGPAPAQDMASVLLGMDGVTVTEAEREADGRLTVWVQVSDPVACPRCGTAAGHVHEYVVTRPRTAASSRSTQTVPNDPPIKQTSTSHRKPLDRGLKTLATTLLRPRIKSALVQVFENDSL